MRSREIARLRELQLRARKIERTLGSKPYSSPSYEIAVKEARHHVNRLRVWLEELIWLGENKW